MHRLISLEHSCFRAALCLTRKLSRTLPISLTAVSPVSTILLGTQWCPVRTKRISYIWRHSTGAVNLIWLGSACCPSWIISQESTIWPEPMSNWINSNGAFITKETYSAWLSLFSVHYYWERSQRQIRRKTESFSQNTKARHENPHSIPRHG